MFLFQVASIQTEWVLTSYAMQGAVATAAGKSLSFVVLEKGAQPAAFNKA